MIKRSFKVAAARAGRIFKWVRCLKYRRDRKQSDHRAIAHAVRLARHSGSRPHLASVHPGGTS